MEDKQKRRGTRGPRGIHLESLETRQPSEPESKPGYRSARILSRAIAGTRHRSVGFPRAPASASRGPVGELSLARADRRRGRHAPPQPDEGGVNHVGHPGANVLERAHPTPRHWLVTTGRRPASRRSPARASSRAGRVAPPSDRDRAEAEDDHRQDHDGEAAEHGIAVRAAASPTAAPWACSSSPARSTKPPPCAWATRIRRRPAGTRCGRPSRGRQRIDLADARFELPLGPAAGHLAGGGRRLLRTGWRRRGRRRRPTGAARRPSGPRRGSR
jgi:hypothetical protein